MKLLISNSNCLRLPCFLLLSVGLPANAILGKVGGRAPEDVILELIRSKCLPALLYGLEACSLRK